MIIHKHKTNVGWMSGEDLCKSPPHEYAVIFPPLSEEQYDALKKSIEENGFDESEPVVVDEESDTIVDGVHRAKVAKELGIQAARADVAFDGPADILKYVTAKNFARRHLDARGMKSMAKALAAAGMKVKDIVQTTGLPKRTVEKTTVAERAEAKEAVNNKVREMVKQGKSTREIAKKTGVSKSQVSNTRQSAQSGQPPKAAAQPVVSPTIPAKTDSTTPKTVGRLPTIEDFDDRISVLAKEIVMPFMPDQIDEARALVDAFYKELKKKTDREIRHSSKGEKIGSFSLNDLKLRK